MHRSRIIILLGAAAALAALAFPFLELPVQGSVNGFEGDAWPAAAALGIPALLAVFGDRAEGLRAPAALVAIAIAGLAVTFAAFKLADAVKAADDGGGSLGPGPWILLVSTLLALAGGLSSLTKRLG